MPEKISLIFKKKPKLADVKDVFKQPVSFSVHAILKKTANGNQMPP